MIFLYLLCMTGMAFGIRLEKAIAGGENVLAGDVKFIAQVEAPSLLLRPVFHCGGVILNATAILTGVNCGGVGLTGLFNSRVRVGSLKRGEGGQVIAVSKKTVVGAGGKMAILTLVSSINMADPQVGTIALYPDAELHAKKVTVAGWGPDKEFNVIFPAPVIDLRKVTDVPVRTNGDCAGFYSSYNSDTEFCAGNGHGGCRQDYGGPAYITDGDVQKLVGIVAENYPCDLDDKPGLYYLIPAL